MKVKQMKAKTYNADELLNKIASSMGAKVVTWETVEEAIQKNITFAKIIDTTKYITQVEMQKLEEKSKVY